MAEERFFYLVSRKLTGEITALEKTALEQLLQQNHDLEQVYKTLFASDAQLTENDLLEGEQAYAAHFVRMQLGGQFEETGPQQTETLPPPVLPLRSRRNDRLWAAAAAVLVAVLALYWIQPFGRKSSKSDKQNEIATRKGSKSRIQLPDGSVVWLNADSKINYAGNFDGPLRELQLTGEAYFDIAKDKDRPFIIHTKMIDVRVLGTAFNIRSYPEEKATVTSLIKGSIEVSLRNQADKKIILKASEKLIVSNNNAVLNNHDSLLHNSADEAEQPVLMLGYIHASADSAGAGSLETLWVNNKLVFDAQPFEVVAADIERWYNVKLVIKNEQIKSRHFTAVFENKSLNEVMEALHFAGGFQYSIKNGEVIIF